MTDRLSLYSGALTVHLGEPPLETLDDDVPVRYALDDAWDRDGVKRCLEAGQWNFACRSARLEYEASITPEFGYRYAFEKPSDFVRTMGVCSDEFFEQPLRQYADEAGYWWASIEQLFVRFVSNDAQYGLDYSRWPGNFTAFVEAWFALQITALATYAEKRPEIEKSVTKLLLKAQSTDAMEQPSKRATRGSWASARGAGGIVEGGSRSRLIG